MNLYATHGRGAIRSRNVFAAGLSLATLFAAQWPSTVEAADAVLVGSSVTLIASADGSPAPTFQWRKNGVAIPGATSAMLSFSAVSLADAATYQVVATNEAGSATSPDELLVVETTPTGSSDIAPVIVTQPEPTKTAMAGGTVTFSVTATGTPTPTFQWQKNGTDLVGATDATLTLHSLTTNDNATYLAIASNSAGTVASNPAVLVVIDGTTPPPPPPVNVAPTILTQPSGNQTATAGGSASFTVSASGIPAPTFQWQKNGSPISGATDPSLKLSFVTLADSAMYNVVVTNIAGSVTSNPADLVVSEVKAPQPPPPPVSLTSAPVITSQPVSTQTVTVGSSVSFTVVASGSPAPTFQWRKNGARIAGATSATFALSSATTADAGTYTVTASNSIGSVVSEGSVLLVRSAPRFTVQPAAQALTTGVSAKFTSAVYAIPGATMQWYKNGSPIAGATSAVLLINSPTTADVGTYSVVAKNEIGETRSDEAPLVIAQPPIITTQPVSQIVSAKSNVVFKAAASGSPVPDYQWKKNGTAITGATQATFELKGVNKSDSGEYFVEARNVAGWVTSKRVTLTVNNVTGKQGRDDESIDIGDVGSSAAAGLVNLSVRANAGSGNDGLIVGFVINGTSSKSVLVRGVGPTLRDFGVTDALADPQLSLYSGSVITASNDDWSKGENAAQIVGTSIRVGAFSLADATSDSALMATLENGAYTVQLSGKQTAKGVALVEVYDAASNGAGKLVNLSVRAYVGTGAEAPNVGFVVAGTTARRVMIRAAGPALEAFGVADSISDPQLELFRGSTRIDLNDNWGGNDTLSSTFAQVGAFGFANPTSRDAVLLTTLEPGAYTVVVSGVNGAKGVGLVEVYDVP